jgi:hypothetical protein
MSDTPETDAQLTAFTSISKLGRHFTNRTGQVNADFARKLERERDQWRECAERLHETVCYLLPSLMEHEGYSEEKAAVREFQRLTKEASK